MSVFWIILPIFTETWKEMATVFKGADNGKRRWCIQGLNAYQVLPLRETAVKETGKCPCYRNTVFTLDHSFISCRVRTTQLSDVELAKCSLGKFYITAQKPRALPSAQTISNGERQPGFWSLFVTCVSKTHVFSWFQGRCFSLDKGRRHWWQPFSDTCC